MINKNDIVITGIGMISCIGFDAETSCASERAGIMRLSEMPELSFYDEETGELIPVTVNSINKIADGFEGIGRLLQLSKLALSDLSNNLQFEREELSNVPIFLNVSSNYYLNEYYKKDLKEVDTSPYSTDEIIEKTESERREKFQETFFKRLLQISGINFNHSKSKINYGEQAGVIFSLNEALQTIHSGKKAKCLIGGVDSLIDKKVLQVMNNSGLLKNTDNATGVIPGEAAAFILIERYDGAIQRGATIFGCISKISLKHDKAYRFSTGQNDGHVLAATITDVIEQSIKENHYPGLMINNLNGDVWKSAELGNAFIHLPEGLRYIKQWFPITSFGEIGAASAAVFLCIGIQSFRRKYSGTDQIVFSVSGDDGTKGSLLLRSLN